MKHFGKKFLALFMALMCIATIGVVSASASNASIRPYLDDTVGGRPHYVASHTYDQKLKHNYGFSNGAYVRTHENGIKNSYQVYGLNKGSNNRHVFYSTNGTSVD